MTKLIAALFQLPVLGQDAMHGAYRAEIDVLVQQGGIDLYRSLVAEPFRVQMIEHYLAFSRVQSPLRRGAGPLWNCWLHAPIQRGPRHTEGTTGDSFTDAVTQLQSGVHQFSSSIWMFGIGLPNNGRGRDGHYWPPPAQILPSGTTP